MMLLHTPSFALTAAKLRQRFKMTPCPWEANRFPNGELRISLQSPVRGEPCVVLADITPPDEHLLTTLLLCHTLKKEGAARATALLPYLAYTRQDKDEPGKSRATPWVGGLLSASYIDEIITVDIHSELARLMMPLPLRSLSPAQIWAQEIARLQWLDATIVAPDHGAVERCEQLRQAAGMTAPIAWFEKHRTPEGVQSTLQGKTGARAIVIDDILDTGGTLLACCEGLLASGAREIIIMVTHGIFTGDDWQRLWELGVKRIYCTDTVPLPPQLSWSRIIQLPIIPLLEDIFAG